MLNALENGKLFSIEYSTQWYRSPEFKSGFAVDDYPELKKKWSLFTGGLPSKFLDIIQGGIDFALIDTMHFNPGEILDFLMVLPFLKDDAIIVLHDTKLCMHPEHNPDGWAIPTNLLLSSIEGKKIVPEYISKNGNIPNIAAVKINKNTKNKIFEIFNLLTVRWSYLPSETELTEVISFLSKHYDKKLIIFFKDIINIQKSLCKDFRYSDPVGVCKYKPIAECPLSNKMQVIDIIFLDSESEVFTFNCGGIDPQIFLPLDRTITKQPYRSYFIEIKYTNTLAGHLQVFYNYGNGYCEENSTGAISIGIELKTATIIIPIKNWHDDYHLDVIRIDPPDNTVFSLRNITFLEKIH